MKANRAIVAIPLDGSPWIGAIRVLVMGADFFVFPTPFAGWHQAGA